MRRQITGSVRAGESTIRIAERLLDIDNPIVELPRYAEELQDAARFAHHAKDPNLYQKAVDKYVGQIRRLGEKGGRAGPYTVRSAAQQLVKDLKKAKPEQIDKVVDRYILDRARYQARLVARHETNEAYRDSYRASTDNKDYVVGYRWDLSPSHPVPDICCRAGTLITTKNGLKAIELIKTGDKVLTHRSRYRRVTKLYSRNLQSKELLRLCFQVGRNLNHEVVLTPNHPVLTELGWIPANDLYKGMICISNPSQELVTQTLPSCGNYCIRQLDFHRNVTFPFEEINVEEQYDGQQLFYYHSVHNCQDSLKPISIQRFDNDIYRYSSLNLSISDFLLSFSFLKVLLSCSRALSTYLCDVFRNLDFLRHFALLHSIYENNISVSDYRLERKTLHHNIRKSKVLFYEPEDNILWNRIVCSFEKLQFQKLFHSIRTLKNAFFASLNRHTFYRNTFSLSYFFFLYVLRMLGTSVSRKKHKFSSELASCILVSKDSIVNINETVFNLGIEEDQSYFANGICVHNCDLYANQDLDGLGPGGYKVGNIPATPHPACMCVQTAIIDRKHFKRKLARQNGEKEPAKPWLSGKKETAEQWLKSIPESKRLEILGPTRMKLLEEGRHVTDKNGALIPVYKLLGQPKPKLSRGPSIKANPIIKRDRENMVRPFPKVPPV